MSRNWLEELVAEYYKFQGYLVITDEDLVFKKDSNRKVTGHSDIDVLAINKDNIFHIECKSWWNYGPKEGEKALEKLKEQFKKSEDNIPEKFPFLKGIKFKKMIVTSGNIPKKPGRGAWSKLKEYCESNDIELKEISVLIDDFVERIAKRIKDYKSPDTIIGKYESFTTRLLLQMVGDGKFKTGVDGQNQ